MKKSFLAVCVIACLGAGLAKAADAVAPQSTTFTNFRDEGIGYISSTPFYRGTSILLTNCVLFAGADTNSAVQGLDGVTVAIEWGTTASSTSFPATVISTNLGTWAASFVIPTNWESPYLQVKVTDSATNSYIYPWKLVITKAALGD